MLDAGSAELGRRIEQKRTELETRARELSVRIKELTAKASSSQRLAGEIAGLKTRIEECTEISQKAGEQREVLRGIGGEKKAAGARKSELEKRKTEEEQKLHVLTGGDKGAHCPLCESPLEEEARAALMEKLGTVISGVGRSRACKRGRKSPRSKGERKPSRDELVPADSTTALLPGLYEGLGTRGTEPQGIGSGLARARGGSKKVIIASPK